MKSPEDLNADIDLLIRRASMVIDEPQPIDEHEAHFYVKFSRRVRDIVQEWLDQEPCIVRYENLYRRHPELMTLIRELGEKAHAAVADLQVDFQEDYFRLSPQKVVKDAPRPATPQPEAVVSADEARPCDVEGPLLSRVLHKFLKEAEEDTDERTAERDVRPYVEFAIHFMGDRSINAYTRDDIRALCRALTQIPHRRGLQTRSLIERYEYAKTHGWEGLSRVSETTIENRYICGLKRCWNWAKKAGIYTASELPEFKLMGKKNMRASPRDAFNDDEIKRLFSMPMFTGHQRSKPNEVGVFLTQTPLYWFYVILIFTGLRHGEIAQLEIDDLRFEETQSIFYFDLRPFDPAKGRVAREDIKVLKSESSARVVPVHPTLVELGLIDRATKLKELGHRRMFPELKPHLLSGKDLKWGHAFSKDWQTRRAAVTQRANVAAYSGRHSIAELLRTLKVSAHDCENFLGHSHSTVNGRYGRKGMMSDAVIAAFFDMDSDIMKWVGRTLIAARDRIELAGNLLEDWAVPPRQDVA